MEFMVLINIQNELAVLLIVILILCIENEIESKIFYRYSHLINFK